MKCKSIFFIGMLLALILISPVAFSAVVEIVIDYGEGAPAFTVEIVDYTTSTSPGDVVPLTSRVTNTGSGNATNVWLDWSIPSDWTLMTTLCGPPSCADLGNGNVTTALLQPTISLWNNVTVTVGETTGVITIMSRSASSELPPVSDAKLVDVKGNWEAYSTLPSIKTALVGSDVTLGVITINSTGTTSIDFSLVANQTWINFNVTSPLTIPASSVRYVRVDATAPSTDESYPYSILIDATTAGVSPGDQTIEGTLVSTLTLQPSLSASIVDYPATAQTGSSISLTTKTENTGQADATNSWLAWTLPSDWTITSGTENVSIGTLQPTEIGWNNITVTVGSATGTLAVSILTNSSEGYGSSDSKNVEVTQPSTDGDGDGPGPGPGPGSILQPAMSLALNPSVLEVYETKSISSTLRVKNVGRLNLNNVRISINGLQTDWYSIQPDSYDMIIPGDTRIVTLSFTPTEKGTYDFKINVRSGTLTESIDATLNVLELTEEAERIIEEEERAEEIREQIEKTLTVIRPLLIVSGMIAPVIIALFMILTILSERCPICGTKMKLYYKGRFVIGYRCMKCKHFEVKGKKKKKK